MTAKKNFLSRIPHLAIAFPRNSMLFNNANTVRGGVMPNALAIGYTRGREDDDEVQPRAQALDLEPREWLVPSGRYTPSWYEGSKKGKKKGKRLKLRDLPDAMG